MIKRQQKLDCCENVLLWCKKGSSLVSANPLVALWTYDLSACTFKLSVTLEWLSKAIIVDSLNNSYLKTRCRSVNLI